jgi:hypothetical protein
VAVRVPRTDAAAPSRTVSMEALPFALGPGEVLLRTYRAEPRFLLREFLGGEGIVLLVVFALGTINTTGLYYFGELPAIVPWSMLILTLVAMEYLFMEAWSTRLHQVVWVTDRRVVRGRGAFRWNLEALGLSEVVPGPVQRSWLDRRFRLARLAFKTRSRPVYRLSFWEWLVSSEEDRFIRGLDLPAAVNLRHLVLSLGPQRSVSPA